MPPPIRTELLGRETRRRAVLYRPFAFPAGILRHFRACPIVFPARGSWSGTRCIVTTGTGTPARFSILAAAALLLLIPGAARALPAPGTADAGGSSGLLVGIEGRYLSEEDIGHLFNSDVGGSGVLVERVREGSPAAKAGLVGGDILAEIQGQPILLGGDLILQLEVHVVCHDDCLKEAPARLQRANWIGVTYLRAGRITTTVIDLSGETTSASNALSAAPAD
jgi:hypothetical protein